MLGSKKTKSVLVGSAMAAALALALFAGEYYFVYITENSINEHSATLKDEAITNAKYKSIENALKDKAPEIQDLESHILPAEGTVEFIDQIENLGKSAGLSVNIDTVNTQAIDRRKLAWENLSIVISGTGSFKANMTFLSMLEHLPYQANLMKYSIETAGVADPKKPEMQWRSEFTLLVLKNK